MDNTQEKPVSFFRFEDLRIYDKATDYSAWILRTLHQPVDDMQRNLVNSFCHSSYDIALNIAEGSSRNKAQFEHYLKIAKTAIRECVVYTEIAFNVGLFTDDDTDHSRDFLMELTRMVGALIISLQRGASRRHDYDGEASADDSSEEPVDALDAIDTNF